MKQRAMSQHFGWDESARDYEKLYYFALGKRRI
jgi:glycogen synthase